MDEKALKRARGQWPNTYVFTKSTAESLVEECAKKVPFSCTVFRSSMILSTYREPIRGWCGNINGLVGMVIGNGIGLINAVYKGFYPADYVPADMCANAMIAITWDAVVSQKIEKEGIVYNYGISVVNPMSVKEFQIKSFNRGYDAPTVHMMGPYYTTYTNSILHYWLFHLTVHLLTALFADTVLLCRGEKPRALSYWILMTKNTSSLFYFINDNWRIHVHRMQTVWNRMNRRDSELFFSDLSKLNWDDYCYAYWAGLRVYILKDPMKTVKAGLRKFNRLELMSNIFYYGVRISILYFLGRWLVSTLSTTSF